MLVDVSADFDDSSVLVGEAILSSSMSNRLDLETLELSGPEIVIIRLRLLLNNNITYLIIAINGKFVK